jgi:hypothetical protein
MNDVGRSDIEASVPACNDDILRWWWFRMLWLREAAWRCVGNSVAIDELLET